MSPEATDALTRLKAAVDGKAAHHAWEKNVLRVSTVEVNPRDVIDLTKDLPPSLKTQSLQSGSANAVESFPEIRTVGLHVVDVLHLIREAESLPAPIAAAPPAPPATQPVALTKQTAPPIAPVAPPPPASSAGTGNQS